jgi:phage terminase large subunit
MTEVQTTRIFTEFMTFHKTDMRIGVFQGGTRSGKTYNIVLGWIILLTQKDDKTLTVCRETMVSLKNTVYRDFMEILYKLGLFDINNLSKGDMTYKLGTNLIEFRNLDDDQKIRGAKRDYLYINEANEIPHPIFKQLMFRTTEKIVLDYNPSDEFHWIYDDVLTRDDCKFHKSTYLDNPFLPLEQVKEIERLKEIDPNYWRVYGLGERGMSEASIYKNWELTNMEKPEGYNCYGLDFGFNDPNALVDIVIVDCEEPYIWVDELLYQSQLTTPELVKEMRILGLSKNDKVYGDNSRPETIQEIYNSGFNIHPCIKGPGSIKAGIDWIKRYKVKITKRSLNLQKEIKSYKWKVDKQERVLDEPVDINNHALDSLRYALSEKIAARVKYEVSVMDDFNF